MTVRDPIEQAGKPAGLCDLCGKLGYLEIGRIHWLRPEWWCETCCHAIDKHQDLNHRQHKDGQ
jgi:hypothetical protein